MQALHRALVALCLIVLLAISGASAKRESWTGRSAIPGGHASMRRSIMGWIAQRKLQGYGYAEASASASAVVKKQPQQDVRIQKQPVQVEKQPVVQVKKQPVVVQKKQPKVVFVQKASPPPPAKKVIAIKKYG